MSDGKHARHPAAIDTAALVEALPGPAVELLAVYTRLEFTLKELGWSRPGRNDAVEVKWDSFTNNVLGKGFLTHVAKTGIGATLLNKPPSVQVITGETLDWRSCERPVSVQDLIGAVRRVRNNLAHGGKGGSPDRERDAQLISEALAVLVLAVGWNDLVETVFLGRY
jgi:hypothetical protein